MQNRARSTRVEYWAFDILYLDGRSLLRAKYSDRRRLLEALAEGGGLIVPDPLPGDGPEAMEYARKQRWEGVVAKKTRLHLPAGPAVVVVDQGQDLEHPGGGDRRLAARRGRPLQRHRGADARHSRRRRSAVRRSRRHRVHREGADQAQGHAQAAAHRRITLQHTASHPGREGRDVRQARVGRRGALQRTHLRRPSAPAELARAAPGQGAGRGGGGNRC